MAPLPSGLIISAPRSPCPGAFDLLARGEGPECDAGRLPGSSWQGRVGDQWPSPNRDPKGLTGSRDGTSRSAGQRSVTKFGAGPEGNETTLCLRVVKPRRDDPRLRNSRSTDSVASHPHSGRAPAALPHSPQHLIRSEMLWSATPKCDPTTGSGAASSFPMAASLAGRARPRGCQTRWIGIFAAWALPASTGMRTSRTPSL